MSKMTGAGYAVGPLGPRLTGVRRIAVLRGGGLGDVLFTLPAMKALARTYPEAQITLLGTPLHQALFDGRDGPVHRVEVLPHAEGVRPGPEDPTAIQDFFARMREQAFDLAIQLHGGGRFSNPFLLRLGARHTVGTRTGDAVPLERALPYLYYQHEVLRALEVVGLVGASTEQLTPRIQVMASDRSAAAPALAGTTTARPRLVIHPGATDVRRRWSVDRFALLARWAAEDGFDVDIVGDESERDLAQAVVDAASTSDLQAAARAGRAQPAGAALPDPGRDLQHVRPLGPTPGTIRSLAGQLSLPGLVGLLAASDVMVGNDSGPRHLAEAVGVPTVGIYWAGNVITAAPLGRAEHRLHIGWTTRCPICGSDLTQIGWTAQECQHQFPLNDAVRPQDVYADVLDLLEIRRGRS